MSPALKRFSRTTFAAFDVPNFRLFMGGQATSLIGTWMQMAAQAWLVLQLTDSATTLGVIAALQTLPVLLLGSYGGVIADRIDKRRAMIFLQAMMGLQAVALGVLTVTHSVHVWEIGALAFILGLNNCFEGPARQSFMLEMVGPEHLRNAVSLNSTMTNVARLLGPGIAGLLIAALGSGWCFLINSVSFIAVISSLMRMNTAELHTVTPTPRAKGQLRAGLKYVRHEPGLLVPLLMALLIGCLAYEFRVTLPYMAQHGLHAGPAIYGFMTSAMGAGAVLGGLVIAGHGRTGVRALIASAFAFGAALMLAALAPTVDLELLALAVTGAASITFMSQANATIQLRAAPEMRGRVMGLWFVAFQGSTPIGGPIVGAVMAGLGARSGLGLAAASCFAAAILGLMAVRTIESRRRPERALVVQ